jgi:hypothetical protein
MILCTVAGYTVCISRAPTLPRLVRKILQSKVIESIVKTTYVYNMLQENNQLPNIQTNASVFHAGALTMPTSHLIRRWTEHRRDFILFAQST